MNVKKDRRGGGGARTVQGDDVHQRADGAARVLPARGREARDPVLRRDRRLVEALRGEAARGLVVLDRVRGDRWEADGPAEVAREIAWRRSCVSPGQPPPQTGGCLQKCVACSMMAVRA